MPRSCPLAGAPAGESVVRRVRKLCQPAPEPAELEAEVGDRAPQWRGGGPGDRVAVHGTVLQRRKDALHLVCAMEKAVTLEADAEARLLVHARRISDGRRQIDRGGPGSRSVLIRSRRSA